MTPSSLTKAGLDVILESQIQRVSKGGDETEEEGGNGEEKIFEIGEAFFGGSGGNASFGICGDSTEDGDRGDDN